MTGLGKTNQETKENHCWAEQWQALGACLYFWVNVSPGLDAEAAARQQSVVCDSWRSAGGSDIKVEETEASVAKPALTAAIVCHHIWAVHNSQWHFWRTASITVSFSRATGNFLSLICDYESPVYRQHSSRFLPFPPGKINCCIYSLGCRSKWQNCCRRCLNGVPIRGSWLTRGKWVTLRCHSDAPCVTIVVIWAKCSKKQTGIGRKARLAETFLY